MNTAIEINLFNFSLIYLLLLGVSFLMKLAKINQSKLLIVASIRMTVQLMLAGYILVYILDNPSPFFVISYIAIMTIFAIRRILSVNKNLNKRFKIIIGLSITFSSISIIIFFITVIIGKNIFNPQYTIPISGMVLGNAMTGISLGVRTFMSKITDSKLQIEVLLNQGATPKSILLPMVNISTETALLPTINSMMGMGIVSLPGMMTGQILAGQSPSTAILYQISIAISIAAVVCLSVFMSLYFGYKTLYNKDNQFNF